MKLENFKFHSIVRSRPKLKADYNNYLPDLRKDFGGRCAYCNLHWQSVATPFEVDHFIPKKVFKELRPELLTDYSNLIFSCKKCNRAKWDKFSGDITLPNPTNELFYDPVMVDYNTIFYRNEWGTIASDDKKGKEMIAQLKLYRPIYILGWLCEKLYSMANQLEERVEKEADATIKAKLNQALANINNQYRKFHHLFTSSYNDNKFSLSGE